MVTPRNPARIGKLLGVNNREADTLLTTRSGTFLRAAVNADLTVGGRLSRRAGYEKLIDGSNMHSLFSNNKRAFLVDGSTLYELLGTTAEMERRTVRAGIAPHVRLSYCTRGEDVIYAGSGQVRRVDAAGLDQPLSVPKMNPAPTLTAEGSDYALTPGLYQVTACYGAADGRLSASSNPVQAEVLPGQALRITGLDATFPESATSIWIYLTPPDGTTFMLLGVLTAPADSAEGVFITADPDLGGVCPTFMLSAMPDGQIVRLSRSGARLLVADGPILYASEPFAHGLHDATKGFMRFDGDIVMIESTAAGTYVATADKTYRFDSDAFGASDLETILPYGAVRGASGTSPDQRVAWWMSSRGLVRAGGANLDGESLTHAGESVKNLQEDTVAMRDFAEGASLYREQDGMKQVISSLRGPENTGAAAYSYFDAEVIRKGTQL